MEREEIGAVTEVVEFESVSRSDLRGEDSYAKSDEAECLHGHLCSPFSFWEVKMVIFIKMEVCNNATM